MHQVASSRRLLFLSLSIYLFASGSLATVPALEVLAFEYPPIYHAGEPAGLACELATAAFAAADIAVSFRFLPVNRMIQSLARGDAVCALGGAVLFKEEAVASRVRVSKPLHYVLQVFLYDVREFPQGLEWTSPGDLANYRIGVLEGSGIHRFLRNFGPLSFELNSIHSGSARQLQAGRVDLWAIVDLTGRMYMEELFPEEAAKYHTSRHYERGDVSVVFSRERDPWQVFEGAFLAGLAEIKRNRTYEKIFDAYYDGDIPPQAMSDDMRLTIHERTSPQGN